MDDHCISCGFYDTDPDLLARLAAAADLDAANSIRLYSLITNFDSYFFRDRLRLARGDNLPRGLLGHDHYDDYYDFGYSNRHGLRRDDHYRIFTQLAARAAFKEKTFI